MADLDSLNAYLKDTEMIIKNGKVQPENTKFLLKEKKVYFLGIFIMTMIEAYILKVTLQHLLLKHNL